jgi:hypothetical protein
MVGSGWASGSFAASSHAASARAPASTGALVAGTTTTWQWTYPSTTFTARVRAEHTRILVSIADGPEIVVQIDHAPTNYGGDRPYFLCPGCATRRWHLDVQGHALACRGAVSSTIAAAMSSGARLCGAPSSFGDAWEQNPCHSGPCRRGRPIPPAGPMIVSLLDWPRSRKERMLRSPTRSQRSSATAGESVDDR